MGIVTNETKRAKDSFSEIRKEHRSHLIITYFFKRSGDHNEIKRKEFKDYVSYMCMQKVDLNGSIKVEVILRPDSGERQDAIKEELESFEMKIKFILDQKFAGESFYIR